MGRRSVFALVGAGVGALVLAGGGYAVGAERHGDRQGVGARSVNCRQAGKDFAARAAQLRKQFEREAQTPEVDGGQISVDRMHAAVLVAMVEENPLCFDAGTRATVAVLQDHATDGQGDAATCELIGRPLAECAVQES